jgi:heme oxygenase
LPKEAYAEWMARQWFIYSALEEVDGRLSQDPVVGKMYSPELHRAKALEADLQYWIGADWRSHVSESAAAKAYAERIREVGEQFPPGYIAHQWLRYLGNVLGQEMLRRLVTKSFGDSKEGLAFYEFPEVPDPKAYLGTYHARMNSIALDDESKDRVAQEGIRAFQLNINLTDELASEFGIAAPSEEETDKILGDARADHP